MIKIDRDNFPPDDKYLIGGNKGNQRWRCAENKVKSDYLNNPNAFNAANKYTFPKHPSYELWRNELLKCQGHKCCYCEKIIDKGELEHFRPKNGYKQSKGGSLNYPGYYWLAYRWKNILLSCGECNDTGRKGNLFPILGVRALNHKSDLNNESCVLINPYEEDPANSISFYKESPISLNARGRETIDILELDKRVDLSEARKDKFALYETASLIASLKPTGKISQKDIDKAQNRIQNAVKPKYQFSGMIRENLKRGLL